MRTQKQLKRLVSVVLILCTLLALCIVPATAEEAATTTADQTAPAGWKQNNGALIKYPDQGYATQTYAKDSGFEYVYFYKGMADSELSTPLSFGFHSDFKEVSYAANASQYANETHQTVPISEGNFWYGHSFAPNYHFAIGIAYTVPYTGRITFNYDYAIPNADHQVLIGTADNFTRSAWNYFLDAFYVIEYPGAYAWGTGSVTLQVTAGEKIYFMVNNKGNGYITDFWINSVEYAKDPECAWKIDNGEAWSTNETYQYYDNTAFDYAYYYQGTDSSLNGKLEKGFYSDYKLGNLKQDTVYGYTVPATTSVSYKGNRFAPQYHFATGVSYTAPFTGRVKFTYQYKLTNAEQQVVVAKDQEYAANNATWFTGAIAYSGGTGEWVSKTVEVDVQTGEKVYFLVDHLNNGGFAYLWVNSAEYISFGEPTTVLGMQQTSVQDGKFDVRLISAVNSMEYASIGYTYSVKYTNGETVKTVEAVSTEINTVYSSLTGNTETGVKEYTAPQNTNLMAGILENVPATGKVELTFTSWAIKKGETAKTEAKTYLAVFENGALKSLTEVTSK